MAHYFIMLVNTLLHISDVTFILLPYLLLFHHLPQSIALYHVICSMSDHKLHYIFFMCQRVLPEVNINTKMIVQLLNKVLS